MQLWQYTTPLPPSMAGWFGSSDASTSRKTARRCLSPKRLYPAAIIFFVVAWAATWFVLSHYTNSNVPVLDGFTNALSFVGLWALACKYLEQWLFWILVDAVSCYLYVIKDIPFKASLYGLYVIIAVMGYFRWRKMMQAVKTK